MFNGREAVKQDMADYEKRKKQRAYPLMSRRQLAECLSFVEEKHPHVFEDLIRYRAKEYAKELRKEINK